ncbi:hypothetical protein AB1K91_17740 [Terribacillus sp. 179-K 1B1 HS]|uniref:hypothetical protein n=1 Tax=Terribacillus sp. 179-K 1B1 HS TaxID=3142388 RepID=UPI0039A2ACED
MTRNFPELINSIADTSGIKTELDERFSTTPLHLLAPDFAYEGALPIDEDPADYFGITYIKAVIVG